MTNFEIRKEGRSEVIVVEFAKFELVRFLEREDIDYDIRGDELTIRVPDGEDAERMVKWIWDNTWRYE